VAADEVVARIETDKVTVDILSQHAGVIKKFFAEEGDTVVVGGELMEIDTDASAPAGGAPAAAPAASTPAPEAPKAAEPVKAASTPAPAAPQTAPKQPQGGSTTQTTAKKAPTSMTGNRTETRVKMSKMRQTISRRLKEA
jgi:2-oxoglutarate dehydrogenase E2 component (dihydrolipoamide succinyltransferase)